MSLWYPLRRFPFWSEVITLQTGSVSVPASSTAWVDIQPPAGETWWLFLENCGSYYMVNVSSHASFDGTTRSVYIQMANNTSYEAVKGAVSSAIITNTLYVSLGWHNAVTTVSEPGYYGYSGFKLGTEKYSLKRIDPPRPWKRKTQFDIPMRPDLTPLEKYIVDVFDHEKGDYVQAIILEEDTPLARDPRADFPVERLTAYVKVDDFVKNLTTIKADPVKAGYKKYFDKWRAEGIKI